MRTSPESIELLARSYNLTMRSNDKMDQDAIHEVLYKQGLSGTIGLAFLPMHFFANGYMLRYKSLPVRHLLRPLVIHFNWILEPKNKKTTMLEFNCWFVEKDLGDQLETLREVIEPDAAGFRLPM